MRLRKHTQLQTARKKDALYSQPETQYTANTGVPQNPKTPETRAQTS